MSGERVSGSSKQTIHLKRQQGHVASVDQILVQGKGGRMMDDSLSMHIHSLPNEVLVSIFTYLRPKELLYGVGMVCKRWHELSKETQSWQKVSFTLWDDRRIWRHAPVIGHLEILAPNDTEVDKLNQLVECPGPACVRSMRIILRDPKDALGILRKYQQSIRTLDLQVGGQNAKPDDWRQFFDMIGMLSELRSLSVRISPNSTDIPYHKQISAGCRALRSLRVRGQETISSDLVRDLGSLVSSLVITCSFTEQSHELIQALSACSAVEEVTMPCSMVGAVARFPSLLSLKLIADHGPSSLEQAVLAGSPALQKIEKLEICTSRTQNAPDLGINQCIALIAKHLKNCKSVDLRGLHTLDEYLSEFINEAKKIQRYELCCRVYHLLQLEQMESVNTVRAVLDSQGMNVPYVVNAVNRLRAHPRKTFHIYFHCMGL